MPKSHDPSLFNVTPYYDDYDENKKFLRTVFKPGRSVQARELTQLQTILQVQTERFGNHLFDNGSVILGGEISESNINYAVPSVSTTDLSGLVGQKITDGTVVAQVYHTLSDDQTVFYQYTTQGAFSDGAELGTTGAIHAGITFDADTIGTDATLFTVSNGIYFVDGYFVLSDTQSIVPYDESADATKTFGNPTNTIGWSVGRSIKSADDDNTLRDPASGFYNYNAPGADRYAIELTLKRMSFTASLGEAQGLTFDTTDYVELIRMVGGSTTKKVHNTNYADIEETFARRTFDESGNYTVTTPGIEVKDYNSVFGTTDTTKFSVGLGPNKSYVSGYEIDTQSNVYLQIDKPRDTAQVDNDNIDVDFGSYIIINESTSYFGAGVAIATIWSPFSEQKSFNLKDTAGSDIGTTNFRTIRRVGTELRAYIFNTVMDSGQEFKNVDKVVQVGSDSSTTGVSFTLVADSNSYKGPFNAGKRSLIIPSTDVRVISESGISEPSENIFSNFVVQKYDTIGITAGGSTGQLTVSNTDFLSSDDNDYIVVLGITAGQPAELLTDSQYSITTNNVGDTKTLDFATSGFTAPAGGASASIIYPVNYSVADLNPVSQNAYRTITGAVATNETITSYGIVQFNGGTHAAFNLRNSHVKAVPTTIVDDDGFEIIDPNIIFDDGQRESSYNRGKIFINITSFPSWDEGASIKVNYDYWSHSGKGPLTVDSWIDAGISYEDIPEFTDPDSGNRYSMRNHIDFRPTEKWTESSGYYYTEFGIPYHNTVNPTYIGYKHYLPRIDKVTLCKDRTYRAIKGASSLPASAPQTSSEDMDLYSIIMKPYVFNIETDVKFKYIDNKRFTMRQIGEIEDDLDRVENDNYLESLKNNAVSRASNLTGTLLEEGVLVDDFSGHAYSDVTLKDHNCSMDFSLRKLHPPYTTDSVKMVVETLGGNLTQSTDGIITHKYTGTTASDGGVNGATLPATGSVQINPYGNTDFLGTLKLSPSSDAWYDTTKNPKVLVNTFGENNAWEISGTAWNSNGKNNGFGTEYRGWTNHWVGEEFIDDSINNVDPQNRTYVSPIKTAKSKLPGRILETINDRVVDKSVVPYMRSVDITFESSGLLPGATVYAMFDGTQVGDALGYTVNSVGSASGSATIPASTHFTGEKLFRLTDSASDILTATNTAADAKFYAQGVLNTKNSTIKSVRPPLVRRSSVKSESIIDDYFENTLDGNFSEVVDGLEPLSQEITVDYGVFPQGVFLESVELFFKEIDSDLPVTIQIKPIVNGIPHPSIVVPFSEVTVKPTVFKGGPDPTMGTTFSFSSPVYLDYGKYAVSILTNSPNNVLFKAVDGEPLLDQAGNATSENYHAVHGHCGIKTGSLFMPLNNGSRREKTNETIKMVIDRCKFTEDSSAANNRVQLIGELNGATASGHIANFVLNDQLFTSNNSRIQYNMHMVGALWHVDFTPNKDIFLKNYINTKTDADFRIHCLYNIPTSDKISPVIDLDRASIILGERQTYSTDSTSGSDLGETQIDSSSSNTRARYVSKIVTLDNTPANNIAVFLKIAGKDGEVLVFVKKDDLVGKFDDNNWVQLTRDTTGDGEGDNGSVGESGLIEDMTFRPPIGVALGNFSRYSIKIVINADMTLQEFEIPVIKDLRVAPLKV
jgi:hypothetical protein